MKEELIQKSRESALAAIKIYNDPLICFKSESYIVLMIIAWTYLLHAYYRSQGITYKYYKIINNRKRYDRTKHGALKYWELERCLDDDNCPINRDTINNLKFIIGLRHEIEHQMTRSLDNFLSGRYQACAINYNYYIQILFGKKYSLEQHMTYSLQFLQLTQEQIAGVKPEADIPPRLKAYIVDFDGKLTPEEHNSPNYSFRLVFTKKLVNRLGQADKVVEFFDPNSEIAATIEKEYWVKKEVERPKFRPKDVAEKVRKEGYSKFRVYPEHTYMWKSENAKDTALGFGVEVQGLWYWYEPWIKKCIELCAAAGDKYK